MKPPGHTRGGRRCRRPRSLFARLMLIWLVGLAIVLGVSLTLLGSERNRSARHALFENIAMDVVTVVSLLDHLPPAARAGELERLQRRTYHFRLGPLPEGHTFGEDLQHPAWSLLRQKLPDRPLELRARREDTHSRKPTLYLGTRLADGTPFLVEASPPGPPTPAPRTLTAMAALILGVALLTWHAVRIATRPLSRLAQAAEALGEDLESPALPETGPVEVRQATGAFNCMQTRIRNLFDERTRILAAITHDLQTPITRMRLRAELMDDERLRDKLLADLDHMQTLVQEGLAYAGSTAAPREPPGSIDLDALAASLVGDYADGGHPVSLSGQCGHSLVTRPATLRRLLGNLVDNALKFGTRAEVRLSCQGPPTLSVLDDGPGIPEAELEKVFEPFYRLESSRNRETGGTGLGLAIARQLARALKAELSLHNRPEGGLEARLVLGGAPAGEGSVP